MVEGCEDSFDGGFNLLQGQAGLLFLNSAFGTRVGKKTGGHAKFILVGELPK